MDANPASSDLYERLGITPDAGQEEIRAAFKQMRKDLHPDGKPESLRAHFNGLMQNVNEANQTLSSPGSRAEYDARRRYQGEARQSQGRQQNAAQDQAERQRQEEACRRAQQAEQQRREAEDRRRREEEEQRGQEEEARAREEEDFSWWDYVEEFGEDENPTRRQPPGEPEPATAAGSFLHKLPGPVHRAMIYTSGSWLWLGVAVVLWNLPFWGAEFVAALVALVVPVIAAGVLFLTWKAAVVIAPIEKVVGFLMPSAGRFSVLWYSRRVIESAVLAPVFLVLAALFSWRWGILSLAAIGYVVLWGVEFFRWRRGRQEVGG